MASQRGAFLPLTRIRWISSTPGARTRARKIAVTSHLIVVSISSTTRPSSAAAAAVRITIATILKTARESIWMVFIQVLEASLVLGRVPRLR